jgi:hypothetical protein
MAASVVVSDNMGPLLIEGELPAMVTAKPNAFNFFPSVFSFDCLLRRNRLRQIIHFLLSSSVTRVR